MTQMRKKCLRPDRRARAGFSLVELMVSVALAATLLVLAVAALGWLGDGYGRSAGGAKAGREARAALDQWSRDVSHGVTEERWWWDPGSQLWRRDEMGMLVLAPEDAQEESEWVGDVVAVSYRVSDVMLGARVVRCLVRGQRDSAGVFAGMRDGGDFGDLFESGPADEVVAFGVVGFQVEPMVWEAAGLRAAATVEERERPDALRMELIVVRPELAEAFATAEDWDGAARLGAPHEAEASKHLEVYECTRFLRKAP